MAFARPIIQKNCSWQPPNTPRLTNLYKNVTSAFLRTYYNFGVVWVLGTSPELIDKELTMFRQAVPSVHVPPSPSTDRRHENRRKQTDWVFTRLSIGRRRLDRHSIRGGGLNFSIFPAMRSS